jgi:REP element-mobilizing transposase RayT
MKASIFRMDEARRKVVLLSIRKSCEYRGWRLTAAHVRSTHVHVVVATEEKPERVMGELNAYASRALVRAGFETSSRPKWTTHGSTRWLGEEENGRAAVDYVLNGQGKDMEVHRGPEPWPRF